MQAENALAEMQEKLNSQKDVMDTQQEKIEELQGFKETQQLTNEQISTQDWQAKKADCEARLKKAQDNIASSQRYLGEDQKTLAKAENGDCPDCYKLCLKSYDCGDSGCDSNEKKTCKKNDADNIKYRKQDVAGDVEMVKKGETELQNVKNECSQYIN